MSHIVTIKTEVRDPVAIDAGCRRLRLPPPTFGEAKLCSGAKTGWQIQLPDWHYPVVCDVNTGQLDYDNFEGRWGDQKHLDAFLQAYAVEKTKIESRKRGHSVVEQSLQDGAVKLTVLVRGGAA